MNFNPNWMSRGPPEPTTGIAGGAVGRAAATAEQSAGTGVIAARTAAHRTVRIGDVGVIEHIEEFSPELERRTAPYT